MAVLKHVWLCMSLLQFGVQAVLGLMMFEWQQMAFMTMTNWHPVLELQHWFFDFTTLYPTQCHMCVDVLPRLSLLRCCSNAILHRTVVNAWQDGRNRKGGNDVSSSQKQPSMILKYINVALFLIFNWFETKKKSRCWKEYIRPWFKNPSPFATLVPLGKLVFLSYISNPIFRNCVVNQRLTSFVRNLFRWAGPF